MTDEQIKRKISDALACFIDSDKGNALSDHNYMKVFDTPLIGYAAADDALFKTFRNDTVVGACFQPPDSWLPGAATVISYFLPFTRKIRDSNRLAGLPSEEWVSARIDGEIFNNAVRAFLVGLIENLDAKAVSPAADPRFRINNNISNWSERHVAFAAGLGTFGLHRGLITSKGTAGRFGSVVTTMCLEPVSRPYTSHNEYCLFFTSGKCGACIKRCPPAAITKQGKDNKACSDYIDNEIEPRFAPRYGCGKCNISVPCEYISPVG